MMNLVETVSQLSLLDEDATIYATLPWRVDSEAIVELEPEEGGIPDIAKQKGMDYFLEVFVAKEFLNGWVGNQKVVPSINDKCHRLIEYAKNDA